MARLCYLIVILAFVSSCAQVGTITGGDKDVFAPQPIDHKVEPPNESTQFTSKSVTIPFNEFIRLNNPAENIVMVPPHATVKSSVKGKSLFLSWEEELQPNTTYSIYLNGAVKDITEGNDSIIQYVFSTGNVIDSLSYKTFVIDALTQKPVKGVSLVLFNEEEDVINLGNTDANGAASLNYIKAGQYKLLAFRDADRNLIPGDYEPVAFKDQATISILQSTIDSIPFQLFQPLPKATLRKVKYVAPGALLVGATRPISDAEMYLDGSLINPTNYRYIADDSLIVYLNDLEPKSYDFVLKSELITDTTSFRIGTNTGTGNIQIRAKKKELSPADPITFLANDRIQSVDKERIQIFNSQDSSVISDFTLDVGIDTFSIHFNRDTISEVFFKIDSGAVNCNYGTNLVHNANFKLNPERKFGTLILDLSSYSSAIILELKLGGKVIQTRSILSPGQAETFELLPPGEYTFRIIHDDNKNGKWDTGNLSDYAQPERIDLFSKPANVRANWEISVPLVPEQ